MDDINAVKSMMTEQLSNLRPHHKVFVRSIGAKFNMENVTLLRHDENGDEIETLDLLWEHCLDHPNKKVVYSHSKGSFHAHTNNNKLRRFLTRGALSGECADMPLSCHICSSRMSPLYHARTPGNMWSARCSYVAKLMKPSKFEQEMNRIYEGLRIREWCVGTGRYASEHWIHSHPSAKACDLCTDPKFKYGYANIPHHDFEMDLKPAPRFGMDVFMFDHCDDKVDKKLLTVSFRLEEYKHLYNASVPEDWWGFNFFKNDTASNIAAANMILPLGQPGDLSVASDLAAAGISSEQIKDENITPPKQQKKEEEVKIEQPQNGSG
jgi:hypothetical protein